MTKRKEGPSIKKSSAKRSRYNRIAELLTDTKSILDQAEPYRLATARLPLHALTQVWTIGSNRPVDLKHAHSLCRIFKEQNLQREPQQNRLRIACSKAAVQRMLDYLAQTDKLTSTSPSHYLFFDDWMTVNQAPVEIMAGQHRVAALKLFLRQLTTQSGDDAIEKEHSWWVCDIYDIDRLPPQLSVQLRANRLDSTLPDNHGQIWMELISLADTDPNLFQGTNGSIQKEMLQALGLSGRVQFPIRRLITLWRNSCWKDVITRWCQTSLGRATFNVSLWEEMARCRVDDFWTNTLDGVLAVISRLVGEPTDIIELADWNVLAQLPISRSARDVQKLFYPESTIDGPSLASTTRRPKLLSKLDASSYYRLYQIIVQNPDLDFPPIQKILLASRTQGKAVSQMLQHITLWLNPPCSDEGKLQLWERLLPDPVEARNLQRRVFGVIRTRMDELVGSNKGDIFAQLPADGYEPYLERFKIPIWRDLLSAVRNVAGLRFQGVLVRFNTEDPASFPLQPEISLVQAVSSALSSIPHITRNPALSRAEALQGLMDDISPILTRWALNECTTAIEAQQAGHTPRWPSRVRSLVISQRTELEQNGLLDISLATSPISSLDAPHVVESELDHGSEAADPDISRGFAAVENRPGVVRAEGTYEPGLFLDETEQDCDRSREEEAGQQRQTKLITTGLEFLDTTPDMSQMRKEHRQRHAIRAVQRNSRLSDPSNPRHLVSHETQLPALALALEPQPSSDCPPPRKKLPSWMHAPAAQPGLTRHSPSNSRKAR